MYFNSTLLFYCFIIGSDFLFLLYIYDPFTTSAFKTIWYEMQNVIYVLCYYVIIIDDKFTNLKNVVFLN